MRKTSSILTVVFCVEEDDDGDEVRLVGRGVVVGFGVVKGAGAGPVICNEY